MPVAPKINMIFYNVLALGLLLVENDGSVGASKSAMLVKERS